MEMAGLSEEAWRLIARDELGSPLEIYSPPTVLNLTIGIVALVIDVLIVEFTFHSMSPNAPVLAVFFLLFYAIVISIIGVWYIFKAVSDRDMRVVICTRGVAFLNGSNSGGFRWQDVLTTFYSAGRKKLSTYTVHCQDGRKFVFQNLSGIQKLAENIDVRVARAKQSLREHLL
ncbi:MAG TPA: hypothetical protein VL485_08745 [Ktedonobacteraceae bacterium]|jgi:hypothetical protein|nr:hypothetical protein [Ktedonobacteraceae bacterium]